MHRDDVAQPTSIKERRFLKRRGSGSFGVFGG
jgi:hypothetical protein